MARASILMGIVFWREKFFFAGWATVFLRIALESRLNSRGFSFIIKRKKDEREALLCFTGLEKS